jgi:hypothetical protein
MSEQSEGEGWWLAVDGRWYAPHLHPDAQAQAAAVQPVAEVPETGAATGEASAPNGSPHDSSRAGSSAATEAARLAAKAEEYRLQSENWAKGAAGERLTGERLLTLSAEFVVLHDLHVPGSRANVDHLVIGPNGVFVVDSKEYTGKLTAGDGTLWRGKYPIRKEVETLSFISGRIAEHLEVPVASILCFTEAELPQQVNQLGAAYAVTLDALVPTLCSGLAIHSADKVKWLARLATELLEPTKREGVAVPGSKSQGNSSAAGSAAAGSTTSPATGTSGSRAASKAKRIRSTTGGDAKQGFGSPRQVGPTNPKSSKTSKKGRKQTTKKSGAVQPLVVIALLLAFLIFGLPRATAWLESRSNSRASPSSTALAVSLPATVAFSCPAPGSGYSMTLGWPIGSKSLISYQIVAQWAGAEIFNQRIFSPAATLPPVPALVPSIEITVITTAISYGKPLPPNEQVVTAPPEPC